MIIQLSLVAVRLFALYFFLTSFYYVPSALWSLLGNPQPALDLHFLVVLGQLLICVLLFSYPRVVLVGLRLQNDKVEEYAQWPNVLQSVGIALIGLAFTMFGLEALVRHQFLLLSMAEYNFTSENLSAEQTVSFWTSVFDVFAGLTLIAIASGISNVLTRLRSWTPRIDES